MPRKAKAKQVSEHVQGALFTDFPEEPALVDAVARVYSANGKTTCKNEERAFAIAEDLIAGMTHRSVAKKYHVGRHTERGIIANLERLGKLAPLKERLLSKTGSVVEKSIEAIDEAVSEGVFPMTHLGLMAAQLIDKLLLFQGDPTVIVGTISHGPTTEQLNDYLKNIPEDASGPVSLPEIWLNKGQLPALQAPAHPPGTQAFGSGSGQAAVGPIIDLVPVPADGQSTDSSPDSPAKGGQTDV